MAARRGTIGLSAADAAGAARRPAERADGPASAESAFRDAQRSSLHFEGLTSFVSQPCPAVCGHL